MDSSFSGWRFMSYGSGRFQIEPYEWKVSLDSFTCLIKVRSVGLCNSDLGRLFRSSAKNYPIVLGHEISGQVVYMQNESSSFQIGDLVTIFPLLFCQKCTSCSESRFNLCRDYSYFGSRQDGGLATFLEVPISNIKRIPSSLAWKYETMIEPASVVFHAINMIPKNARKVLITGSGFLSYLAVLICEQLGFEMIKVVTSNPENHSVFKDKILNPSDNYVTELFDSCLDFSGNFKYLEYCSELLTPSSVIVTVANSRPDTFISSSCREKLLRKELQIVGSWNSDFGGTTSDWDMSIPFLSQLDNFDFPLTEVSFFDLPSFLTNMKNVKRLTSRIQVKLEH